MPAKKKTERGRPPKKEVDFLLIEQLCQIQCTGEEIAAVLQLDYDTVAARIKEKYNLSFSEYIKKHAAGGKASLRRMQWKAAKDGNVTAMIWLGKQYLGQTDKRYEEPDNDEPSSTCEIVASK